MVFDYMFWDMLISASTLFSLPWHMSKELLSYPWCHPVVSHNTTIFVLVTLTLKLDLLLKNFNLGPITFQEEEVGLSYCTCLFLVTRPFTSYYNFWNPTYHCLFEGLYCHSQSRCYLCSFCNWKIYHLIL